jgi:hypothetical protein
MNVNERYKLSEKLCPNCVKNKGFRKTTGCNILAQFIVWGLTGHFKNNKCTEFEMDTTELEKAEGQLLMFQP